MRPKRALSQHFLTNPRIARAIAESATLAPNETVLEIGPGKGILTSELLARAKHVIAIEKDDALYHRLKEDCARDIARGSLSLIHGDALKHTPSSLGLAQTKYVVVANIPYNITGALIRHLLSAIAQPSRMVLLVQKEVAERIVVKNAKESVLSLSVRVYGQPRIERIVKAGSFHPMPKVDSAVLCIEHISRKRFQSPEHEKCFFALIRAAFSQKRKRVGSNLKQFPEFKSALTANITGARAEDVPLDEWIRIAKLSVAR